MLIIIPLVVIGAVAALVVIIVATMAAYGGRRLPLPAEHQTGPVKVDRPRVGQCRGGAHRSGHGRRRLRPRRRPGAQGLVRPAAGRRPAAEGVPRRAASTPVPYAADPRDQRGRQRPGGQCRGQADRYAAARRAGSPRRRRSTRSSPWSRRSAHRRPVRRARRCRCSSQPFWRDGVSWGEALAGLVRRRAAESRDHLRARRRRIRRACSTGSSTDWRLIEPDRAERRPRRHLSAQPAHGRVTDGCRAGLGFPLDRR